jgi:hypothetical protein
MGRERHSAEEVVNKLRQADVELDKAILKEATKGTLSPARRSIAVEEVVTDLHGEPCRTIIPLPQSLGL